MHQTDNPKIAVIVAGIDEEYQSSVLEGVIACAKANGADVVCFAAFGGVLANNRYDIGEYNIYHLVNYERFDGAILLTNTICAPDERQRIVNAVKAAGVPAVVLDSDENPEFYNIHIDNTHAMRAVVEHVITFHGAQVINYISGPLSNPEACARYQAFQDVMAENGLTVDPARVFFGEFRGIDGKRAIDALYASGLELPDAVICANDAMALEAVATLEKHGCQIPRDLIVTGFDNTYYARHHSPSLTSVARPLYDAGYSACDTVLKLAAGIPCEKTVALQAEPVFMESCGCRAESAEDMQNYKKSSFGIINSCRTDISLLNRMTSELAGTETVADNIRVISQFLEEMGCEQCSICLCDGWQSSLRDSDGDDYPAEGYTEEMTAPLIWTNGEISSVESFRTADMFPMPLTGGGNVSYIFPLHFVDRCLGYYILTNSDFPTRSMLCHTMMLNISHSIENIRKLLHLNNAIRELDRLYVIDPLCGIYNRNGFIRLADQMYRRCREQHITLLISFIDMDGLKMINDNYGHDEGDFALQRLASVIQSCCDDERICARFGGDEFIIVACGVSDEDPARLEREFSKRLKEMNRIINKPYELSASIGSFVTEVDGSVPMFGLITQADKIMYEQKKKKKTSRYLRRD